MYDLLMLGLRNEDPASFINFLCMPAALFDELQARVGPQIIKQYTFYRDLLEHGIKLDLTIFKLF
jgi:hypothetical protein